MNSWNGRIGCRPCTMAKCAVWLWLCVRTLFDARNEWNMRDKRKYTHSALFTLSHIDDCLHLDRWLLQILSLFVCVCLWIVWDDLIIRSFPYFTCRLCLVHNTAEVLTRMKLFLFLFRLDFIHPSERQVQHPAASFMHHAHTAQWILREPLAHAYDPEPNGEFR